MWSSECGMWNSDAFSHKPAFRTLIFNFEELTEKFDVQLSQSVFFDKICFNFGPNFLWLHWARLPL